MNIALILAGGVGSRSGLNYPKQYFRVNEKPVLVYTLEKFQKAPSVDRIVVVCSAEWENEVKGYKEQYGIGKLYQTCLGGNTGLKSVLNGLNGLQGANPQDLIILHDAVRPFVDVDLIEDNISIAKQYGNAMAAVPCVETLVFTEDGKYAEKMIPRDGLKRIQTPQTFKFVDLYSLLSRTDLDMCREPSAFSLWMTKGKAIFCSQGNEKNIKITYPEDLDYFQKLFE